MADFTAKQGDSLPAWNDTLTYTDGTPVDLGSAGVNFVMRSRNQTAPATNAAAVIINSALGQVAYTPTIYDTAAAGLFNAYWLVSFPSGATQRFPTVGYLTVEIEENLETPNQTIVELDEVKEYLNLDSADRVHDAELLRFVAALTPVVEHLAGPVLPRIVQNETYDGGYWWISLRHRPVISVEQIIEYRGPIPYNLQQVPTPDLGTIYSYMFEPPGRVVRRTVGGGVTPFPPGADQVFVTYTAGRLIIPENIRMATLELVRVNYQRTQQAGGGRIGAAAAVSDEELGATPMLGFLVPGRVREFLQPSKRHPAVA